MRLNRVGAIACFVLTVQFVLTVLWIVVSWPPAGFTGLADAMANYFLSRVNSPYIFAAMNFYNVSFALSAMVLAMVMREMLADYPRRTDMAVYLIVVAASLYIASGVVPLVSVPGLVSTGNTTAVETVIGVSTGLLLGATMASGFALLIFAWLGFASKRLPFVLCLMLLTVSLVEVFEFAVPVFLLIDPVMGTFWSMWLGALLWNDRIVKPTAF